MQEQELRIDLDAHTIRCRIAGAGDTTFVCLHGLVDRLEIWDALAPELAERGRVVRMDQRGHGASDAPAGPFTREDLAADVAAVLRALGSERGLLIGHSMGGVVSMTLALERPELVEGLVLIGTASQCTGKVAAWYERIAQAGERDGRAGLVRLIYGDRSRRSIEGDPAAIARVTRTLKSLHEDPLTEKLRSLACPVLILVGEKDPMGPRASEILRDALPPGSAELHVLPGHGHWLHVDAPAEVLRAVDAWSSQRGLSSS